MLIVFLRFTFITFWLFYFDIVCSIKLASISFLTYAKHLHYLILFFLHCLANGWENKVSDQISIIDLSQRCDMLPRQSYLLCGLEPACTPSVVEVIPAHLLIP